MNAAQPVSVAGKLAGCVDHGNRRIVGAFNGNASRPAKIAGEFARHSHVDTDALFLPVNGRMRIAFRRGIAGLVEGDMPAVLRAAEHRPVADGECHVLLMHREGEPNTGSQPSHMTRTTLEPA